MPHRHQMARGAPAHWFALALAVVALPSRSAFGEGPTVKATAVVVSTVRDPARVDAERNRVAEGLGIPLAPHAGSLSWAGAAVQSLRQGEKETWVVAFVGSRAEAEAFRAKAAQHFRGAELRSVDVVDPESDEAGAFDLYPAHYRQDLLVVGSFRSAARALAAAQDFARRSGQPLAEWLESPTALEVLLNPAGSDGADDYYLPRRDDSWPSTGSTPFVSVELSGAYEGFADGFYIVVAGILPANSDTHARLVAARRIVPDAFVRTTTLYMGCRH